VLLVVADGKDSEAVERFRRVLAEARIESIPDAIHDLVSFAPDRVANAVGTFVAEHR
jgi:hypothetical protein